QNCQAPIPLPAPYHSPVCYSFLHRKAPDVRTHLHPLPQSGIPHSLSHGDYTADIASTGATLRTLRFRGRDLIVPFDADKIRPCFHGSILAPWPNRLANGCFTHEGERHQLPLSEPERHNALHGL